MTELQYAAYCGDLNAVEYLLAQGDDPKASDDFGYTALHWNARMACAGGGDRVAVAHALLNAGADPNAQDNEGATVLANAVEATAPDDHLNALKDRGVT